jgi:nicotinamidase-related amidase
MTTLDRSRSAVLVMDYQASILGMLGDAAAPVVEHAAAVVSAARAASIPVMYVVIGFRPGYPEVNPQNPSFAPVVQSGRFVTETPGSDVHAALKPLATDVVIVKHRVSAFAGTDLDMVLRAKSIDTLVLLGISTSGVVLSSVRHAADADYRLLVVEDGCADRDDEVHRVLLEKVLARQATVLSSTEVIEAMRRDG